MGPGSWARTLWMMSRHITVTRPDTSWAAITVQQQAPGEVVGVSTKLASETPTANMPITSL